MNVRYQGYDPGRKVSILVFVELALDVFAPASSSDGRLRVSILVFVELALDDHRG